MKLKTVGTGSSGNCYLLESESEILILDAGVPLKEVKRAMDYQIGKVVGCLVSHRHLDHSKYIEQYQRNGIRCYSSDTVHKDIEEVFGELTVSLPDGKKTRIGGFTVQPFDLVHDVPNSGFLISHQEIGKMLYITDTELVGSDFSQIGINQVLVECNYDKRLIDENYLVNLRNRVMLSHMELQTCVGFIQSINSPHLYNICLCHLSDSNSDETKFLREISQVAYGNVYVANKGQEIELRKSMF